MSAQDQSRQVDQSPPVKGRPASVLLERIAVRESRIWALVLTVLTSLAAGLAVVAWSPEGSAPTWRILPAGLVILVLLFVVYVWSKSTEIAELRGLVRGLEVQDDTPPSLGQLEKLFGMVQRSQQGYRDLIDTIEDPLFSISLEGKVLAANKSTANLLGRPFSELVGLALDEFVDLPNGCGRAEAQDALPELMKRRHWSGTLRLQVKHSGAIRYFECAAHVLVHEGRDCGIGVVVRDVTHRKESEARFTELFETLQEGVYVAAPDGTLNDVNPAMSGMLGYARREELRGRHLTAIFENSADWLQKSLAAGANGATKGGVVNLKRRDGAVITCFHNATAIRNADGKTIRLQGTLVDVTARRQIEHQLHQQQEFARRLIDCFPDVVVAVDPQGRCTFVSPRCKQLLGYEPEEIIGQRLSDRLDVRDRPEFEMWMESIRSSPESAGSTTEVLLESQRGEMRLFRATAGPLLDELGNVEGLIVSLRDVTESKKIEQQLTQSERLAAMGQMVAGAAHELNNPLTAVLGVTEMLKDSMQDVRLQRHLDLVHAQARRAANIVQSLLSFARPSHPRTTRLQLDDVIERSLQLHERSLRGNNVTVDFVRNGVVTAVLGDAGQLTQVFLNLIINAEQAIREVRDQGTLRIRVTTVGERIVATFQDDGAGIRRDVLPKIFDPFFTTKRPGRGTGLGLSICMAILREHHGSIEATTVPEGGTVFTLSIPVARGNAYFSGESAPASSSVAMATAPTGCSLLVVDDEESIREMVRDGLISRGMRVDAASTGEEALCMMESRRYDVVLCDLNLTTSVPSAFTGRELYARASRLVTSSKPPLFIFMTGEMAEQMSVEDGEGRKLPTLQKPFRMSELAKLVSDVLDPAEPINPQLAQKN